MKRRAQKSPNLYIIAGPNGAGKTTFAREFLLDAVRCKEFINADSIAQGLSPFAPDDVAIQAGRLMLEQIEKFADRGIDFAFETTLSGRSYYPRLCRFKENGYSIHLYFLWLPEVKFSLKRVAERVKHGGHNIPSDVIQRRFKMGISNLFRLYDPALDFWSLINNSVDPPQTIALKKKGEIIIYDKELFDEIKKETN